MTKKPTTVITVQTVANPTCPGAPRQKLFFSARLVDEAIGFGTGGFLFGVTGRCEQIKAAMIRFACNERMAVAMSRCREATAAWNIGVLAHRMLGRIAATPSTLLSATPVGSMATSANR